ncbi:sigma-70 factor domain-containing protein, partial [Catellatospora coxensis]
MTEARQISADVRSLTDMLLAQAAGAGGRLTPADVARTVEAADVTPAQAKKMLRALLEAGVTVEVDDSANGRRKVAAARAATPASKATTAKAAPPAASKAAKPAAPKQATPTESGADAPAPVKLAPKAAPAKAAPAAKPVKAAAKAAPAKAEDGAEDKTAAKAAPAKKAAAKKAVEKKTAEKAAPAKAAKKGEPGEGDEPDGADLSIEELAADLEDVVVDEPVEVAQAAEADAAASDDFEWDAEESEALKQARKDAELTASADSVRAYLKQIGKVPLLNAEQEVELAKRIEAGLYAAERLRQAEEEGLALTRDMQRDLLWVSRDGERAKNHLLEANLRLVVSLAKRYTG